MNCFLMCPKKFEYVYVLKERETEGSDAQQFGFEFHEFADHLYENITFKDDNYFIDDNYLQSWLEKCSDGTIPLINNFLEFEVHRWLNCKELLPNNPQKLFVPLLRESKFVSDKLERVTILDRLDLRLDGNYTVVEYKTGKFAEQDWKKTDLRREMCFERSVPESCEEFQKSFNKDIIDFAIIFPKSNNVLAENYNWRSMSAMEKAVKKIKDEHVAKNYYPCNVGYHCSFCHKNMECPMEFTDTPKNRTT